MGFSVEAYRGVMVPLVTPFQDEQLDEGALRELVQYLIEKGVRGFLALGTTGEAAHLSDPEAAEVVRCVVRAAAGRVPVLAGSGRASTRETITATERLASEGADAVMVLTPYYYRARMDASALQRHYAAIADASPVPVFVYHMPGVTGVDLAASTLAPITRHANVWGFKDSATEGGPLAETLRLVPTCGLVGSGGRFLEGLRAGAAGGVLAIAHVVPELCIALYSSWTEGDVERANAAQQLASRLSTALHGWAVPGLKHALRVRGLPGGVPRAPLAPPPAEVRERVEAALRAALAMAAGA